MCLVKSLYNVLWALVTFLEEEHKKLYLFKRKDDQGPEKAMNQGKPHSQSHFSHHLPSVPLLGYIVPLEGPLLKV